MSVEEDFDFDEIVLDESSEAFLQELKIWRCDQESSDHSENCDLSQTDRPDGFPNLKKLPKKIKAFFSSKAKKHTAAAECDQDSVDSTIAPGISAPTAAGHKTTRPVVDGDVYDFTHSRRGLAVIINNEYFTDRSETRYGSARDAAGLVVSLRHLGFDVVRIKKASAVDLIHLLQQLSTLYDHGNADCFVCCIMTHGTQQKDVVRKDLLVGMHGNTIPVATVVNIFSDTNCPALKGKPRLFFLQACRGQKLDKGQNVSVVTQQLEESKVTAGTDSTATLGQNSETKTDFVDASVEPEDEQDDEIEDDAVADPTASEPTAAKPAAAEVTTAEPEDEKPEVLPSPAPLFKDFLIMYAAPPGYMAWRRSDGAWFIQTLCVLLTKKDLGTKSLLSQLVHVSGWVANNYLSGCGDDNKEMHGKKLVPVVESKLVKDIFMTRKFLDRKEMNETDLAAFRRH